MAQRHVTRQALVARELDEKHGFSTDKPPARSLFWTLWVEALPLAREALNSAYIQGIAKGDLDPRHWGSYAIQDAAYCMNVLKDLNILAQRGTAELQAFSTARRHSYERYLASLLGQWHLKDTASLSVSRAAEDYIALEQWVCASLPPAYGLIAMLPCEFLWHWLAEQMRADSPPGNLYQFWIEGNASPDGGYRLGNVIDDLLPDPTGPERAAAHFVFQSAVICEVNFFRSATGQDLLEMPPIPDGISLAGKRSAAD